MTDLPSSPPPRVASRDRLLGRVSVMGQVTTLLALTSTGVVAGVLAHDAQVKDLLAQQRSADPAPVAPPALVPVTHKPLRTVVVTRSNPASKKLPSATVRTSTRRRTSGGASTTTRTARTATARAPRPATSKPSAAQPAPQPKPSSAPVTTTSGS